MAGVSASREPPAVVLERLVALRTRRRACCQTRGADAAVAVVVSVLKSLETSRTSKRSPPDGHPPAEDAWEGQGGEPSDGVYVTFAVPAPVG